MAPVPPFSGVTNQNFVRNPVLVKKGLLDAFYQPQTLASIMAKSPIVCWMCLPVTRKETMRTTINVDEQLLMQAKAQAATLGVTLAQLIEDALRASLMRRENMEQRGRVRLITMPGTGTRPGIALDNRHALLEIMEQ
jgi:hypothetical protein